MVRYFWPGAGSALLAIISFILVIFAILPGHIPGYMEDYHVVYVGLLSCSQSPMRCCLLTYSSSSTPRLWARAC